VPHTLLLADDSVTIQRVIELTFADEDVDVVAVSDGDQAIARLDAAPPDIVLADIGMPGRNGYEVARYVKQSPRLSHIPVVLLTGAFEPVDQARAIEVGCDGVLAKPFEPQLVIGRVKELLTSEPKKAQPAAAPVGGAAPAAAAETPPSPETPAAPVGPEPADLDDYFDRLDVAFAKLASQPVGKAAMEPESESGPEQPQAGTTSQPEEMPRAESLADQIDWYAQHSAPARDVPVSYASPQEAFEAPPLPVTPPERTADRVPSVSPTAPVTVTPSFTAPASPGQSPAAPSIADAFAAILASERHEPVPEGAPEWPRSFAPPPAPEITDEVIEAVTRRVLDRMSDRVVHDTVSTIVADVAERLVREEIAKIKSALR
jgi:CheY-like chemotaxis protein